MDRLSDELGVDDNGLQNASQQEFWQEIASSDCTIETARKDCQFSDCDAIPPEKDEAEFTEIATDQTKCYLKVDLPYEDEWRANSFGECSRTSGVVNDEDNKQSMPYGKTDSKGGTYEKNNVFLPACHKIKKEEVENVESGSSIRSGEVETKEAIFRSGRSVKDGGFSKSNANLEILSSMATFCVLSFATISLQFSISLTVGILLLMPSVGVEGALTSVPANTLFVVGKTARMNCSTDLNKPVYWARTLAGSDVEQWLYYGKNGFNGHNADGRFSIDKDEATGRYDVIVEDIQPRDAGHYVCVDDSGIGARASAELVVSGPISCKSRIAIDGVMGYNVFGLEQNLIEISCSLNYTGTPSPTLEWSWPDSEVEGDEPTVFVSTSSVTSTLKLSPTKERDNVQFHCRASIESAIQNSMDSRLLWESEIVNVRYAEFASKEVEVCPGVKWNLVCNPQCSYHFERKDQVCQCRYTYHDKRTQQSYEVTSDAVKCNDTSILLNALITVAVVAAVLLAAIFVVAFCLKRQKMKRRPADGSGESGPTRNDDDSSKAILE